MPYRITVSLKHADDAFMYHNLSKHSEALWWLDKYRSYDGITAEMETLYA